MPELEHNKQNIMAFYDLMFNQCKPAEAVERFVGATYADFCHLFRTKKGSAREFEGGAL